MMRAASMNILCHVMGDREILSLRWGALHGDTRNALISTPLVVESSPMAFWKSQESIVFKFPILCMRVKSYRNGGRILFFSIH